MNRRDFIARSSAVAASVAVGSPAGRAAGAAECNPPLGVQLFTLREELQRDLRGTLARLREIGFTQAELYGLSDRDNRLFGLTAAELKNAFTANALSVELAHVDGSLTNTAVIADFAAELGITTAIVALPSELGAAPNGRSSVAPAEGRAQLDALAEKLDRTARDYGARGIQFGYHNHAVELMPIDGIVPLDYLMSRRIRTS